MFENIIRELEKLKGQTTISVPLDADEDGYIDKECPNEGCLFEFKVLEEDWKNLFQEGKVFCPMCRHEADVQSWYTTEQIEKGKQHVESHLESIFNRAFEEDARNFNARQNRNSFLNLTMKVTGSNIHYMLPISAKEEMELKIECKECNAHYAVIGSAFFCPCCGHNSVEETFDNAVRKIEAKIKNLSVVRLAIQEISKDEAELTCRSLIETSLNDCVVAFQRFCELSFIRKYPSINVRFNAFQNLDSGGEYWQQQLGESYSNWIAPDELTNVKILFQKRHLLSHTEGIVDLKYIQNSGDHSYIAGQRIVIREEDIHDCLEIIQKLIKAIKDRL